ncbi:hypothetical protein D3C81_1590410 [compost metagenome]
MAAGHQQAEFVQGAGGGGEGRRGGQGQGTRASCYQHGQHDPEGPARVQVPPPQADGHGGDQGEQQKPLRGAVGDLGQARFFGLGAFQQADDGRQPRVVAEGFDLNVQGALDVQRAAGDPLADAARLRQVFAGQQ